jgi:Peptidase A4 family
VPRLIPRVALTLTSVAMFALIAAPGAMAHRPPGALIPTHPREVLPLHGGTVDSLNWSGYAVTPHKAKVTAVSSTFKVPAAGQVPPGFAATWAGIGGYNTKDLIQAGTAEQSPPSNPLSGLQYFAWYELLPNSETQLSGCRGDRKCTVKPGDHIAVHISQASANKWKISMKNAGHWTWSKSVRYKSTRSSAEWILEAPSLIAAQTLLAGVGTVHFGPTSTYTAGGHKFTIAQGNPTKIVLSPGGVFDEATPSALGQGGQSFNDCAYSQTCKAP